MRDPSPFLANLRILKTIHAWPSIRAMDDLYDFIRLCNARNHRFCGTKEPSVSQNVLGTPNVYLGKIRSAGQDLAGAMHLIGEHFTPGIPLGTLLFVLMVPKKQLIKVLGIWSDCARGSSRERMRLLSGIADIMGNTIKNIKLHRQSLVEKKDHFFGSVNSGMQSQSGPAKKIEIDPGKTF